MSERTTVELAAKLRAIELWDTDMILNGECADRLLEQERVIASLKRSLGVRADRIDKLEAEIDRLGAECNVWMNGVADAVEPLGYDREGACGPADLLPGLSHMLCSECQHLKDDDNARKLWNWQHGFPEDGSGR